jgi:6-phosphofructokinase
MSWAFARAGVGSSTSCSNHSGLVRSRACYRGEGRSSGRPGRIPTSSTAASTASWKTSAEPSSTRWSRSATDQTFGFDTAITIATEAIDRLHTTAESHNRVMVVEVMGRHTGWIAVMSGIAGGADMILIPEQPISIDDACADLRHRHERGKDFSIVVVSEGYELEGVGEAGEVDQFGHTRLSQRGVGDALARQIEERTGFETRVTVLGHVQRGGSPTARDRVLATRFGLKAADLAHEKTFGRMAALQGDQVVDVSLVEATKELKTVPPEWYQVAKAFFG